MSRHISALSRRQFLRKTAFFAGLTPLANLTIPSFSSKSLQPVQSNSLNISNEVLVFDTTFSSRARYLAFHLFSIGRKTTVVAGDAASSVQLRSDLAASGTTGIAMGTSVPHVLKLATTRQIGYLVLDLSESVDIDLSAEFEALKISSVKTLIVQDLLSADGLSRIMRFIQTA